MSHTWMRRGTHGNESSHTHTQSKKEERWVQKEVLPSLHLALTHNNHTLHVDMGLKRTYTVTCCVACFMLRLPVLVYPLVPIERSASKRRRYVHQTMCVYRGGHPAKDAAKLGEKRGGERRRGALFPRVSGGERIETLCVYHYLVRG
mmetsp:Transcript_22219/g.32606  ORF Transcript_22219/g.32606 Transcript_22219/m.32606 type:complete len:147 (-) Transcript_22219:47-487(-)